MPTTLPSSDFEHATERLVRMGFERTAPAVDPDASVEKEGIVCLFDGVKRKHLATYLRVKFGITPAEYRFFWNLPETYPLSIHAEQRTEPQLFAPASIVPLRACA